MIEKALIQHLRGCEEQIGQYMASYAGQMAIFNQEAPSDMDEGWGEGSQYCRIVIAVEMREDPERQVSGTLMVDLCCQSGKQAPEEIEPLLKPLIDGYFFKAKDATLSAIWNSSNYFTEPKNKVDGVTLRFDLYAYPDQTTLEPEDPIKLLNAWSKDELSELSGKPIYVIGHETLPEVFKPDADHPAIYWRITRISKCAWIPDTWAASYQTATIRGHILAAESKHTANLIARVIDNTLTNQQRLRNDDFSMFVDRRNAIDMAASPVRTGQITVEASYGIPNIPPESEKLKKITISERR